MKKINELLEELERRYSMYGMEGRALLDIHQTLKDEIEKRENALIRIQRYAIGLEEGEWVKLEDLKKIIG